MQFILLVLGLAAIIKSADILIDSVTKIARRFGISTFIIGITVIAFGTSAPELAIGILSGINNSNELTLGNIIGSSLSNFALIVGISSLIIPLQIKDTVTKRELPMLIGVQVILTAFILWDGKLSRTEGIALLFGFIGFMLYVWRDAKNSKPIEFDAQGDIDIDGDGNNLSEEAINLTQTESILKLCCYTLISLIGLFIGGKLTVDSSTQIAQIFGLSETLIGLTVVSLTTTMPELITSIIAVSKKEPDIVLGNCIGSNMFNILLVLGVSSSISPIQADLGIGFDLIAMVLLTLYILITSSIRKRIRKFSGFILLSSYVLYITYKVVTVVFF